MKSYYVLVCAVFLQLLVSQNTLAQNAQTKSHFQLIGVFDAGQPETGIYKVFDQNDQVICYVLMPESASKRKSDDGKWLYDGNSIGSISCVKIFPTVTNTTSKKVDKKL